MLVKRVFFSEHRNADLENKNPDPLCGNVFLVSSTYSVLN